MENPLNPEARMMAISKEEVKSPMMPIDKYIQEAEDQKVWAENDKDALTGVGLNWTIAESIPVLASVTREKQSIWTRENKSHQEIEKEWQTKSSEGYHLKSDLLAAFRFAFRKNTDLLAKVAIIDEGTGHDDMIQDLSDLSVIGMQNTSLLSAIKFDIAKLEQAASIAKELAMLLAGVRSERDMASKELEMRNRAYTLLKEAVDEVRAYGKYVFRNNEERLRGYRSDFLHKANLRKREKGR